MQKDDIFSLYNEYIAHTYGRNELALVRGEGMYAYDAEGNAYLDFSSGIGVNSLGYCDGDWVAAVTKQAETLQHTSNLFYTEPAVKLAQMLCQKTGYSRVFFANSGAEANEGALKAARKYSLDKYGEQSGRYEIISLNDSFHGRTVFTLTVNGQEVFHNHFGPLAPGIIYSPANDLEALKSKINERTCAVIIEPVQGEGGVIPLNKAFVEGVRALCDEKDLIMIADEVQTGIGRTGKLLACEHFGVKPDITTLAKGLGGGLPIGAVLFNDKTKDVFAPGDHGSTFGANPVVCAGAREVLEKLTDKKLAAASENAAYLWEKLEKLPKVKSVDGMGLMIGITFEDGVNAKDIIAEAIKKGLLTLSAKTKLRLLPPLIVSKEDIDKAVDILSDILEM